ncbi:hypothetical protein KSS87_010420 [Heliosperma pusillum]|nr:hypothetical protein KSS87_010420 [Heliosperma pusillum]
MSTTTPDSASTPLLTSIHNAASVLYNRRMFRGESIQVRRSAALEIAEQRTSSTMIIAIDLIWNTSLVLTAIVVMVLSKAETTNNLPLRLWIVVYGILCVISCACNIVMYWRRGEAREDNTVGIGLNLNSDGGYVQLVPVRNLDEGYNIICSRTERVEIINRGFSLIWWIIGYYWLSLDGHMLADDAPKLFGREAELCFDRLMELLLMLDLFAVGIFVSLTFLIGIGILCFLPIMLVFLCNMLPRPESGASEEVTTQYTFRRLDNEPFGGIMTQYTFRTQYNTTCSFYRGCCVYYLPLRL